MPSHSSSSSKTGMLVVEGFISYNTPTIIRLSRTTLLSEKKILPEPNASVIIEGENSSEIPAIEKDSGVYIADNSFIDPSARYRVKIRTTDNKLYTSDYRKMILTPAINEIIWERNNGVDISVNTSDPDNNTEYYKWDYEETWQFRSKYKTNIKPPFIRHPDGSMTFTLLDYYKPQLSFIHIGFYTNDSVFNCWRIENSTRILLGTTKLLSENRIYKRPLTSIPDRDWRIGILYSIKVTQYGISRECYDFYNKLKKNTELLGSVFDSQPSEIRGNIRCATDTSELVLGFVDACGSQEKRLFIDNKDLPGWYYEQPCSPIEPPLKSIVENNIDSIEKSGVGYIYLPTIADMSSVDSAPPYKILWAGIADKDCVDCTLRGTNTRPDFWP